MMEVTANVVQLETRLKLPIKTVDDIVEEAGEEVPWIIEDILARGAVTDFSGPAKKGGKTTFFLHAIAAGARGDNIADFLTKPAKYLYLTEQGNNIKQALEESGLNILPDYIRVVQYKDVANTKWKDLYENAAEDCRTLGFDALIIDTFARFSKLRGAEENESGPVGERMQLLSYLTQKHDIATAIIRHSGKDGFGRGSSAFEGEADLCISISRRGGNHPLTQRHLTAVGRYGEWERIIELKAGRYFSHGNSDKVQFNRAVRFIMAVLPESPGTAITKKNIMEQRKSEEELTISAATIDRALKWLCDPKQGKVGMKQLMHLQGKPKVYWKAAQI